MMYLWVLPRKPIRSHWPDLARFDLPESVHDLNVDVVGLSDDDELAKDKLAVRINDMRVQHAARFESEQHAPGDCEHVELELEGLVLQGNLDLPPPEDINKSVNAVSSLSLLNSWHSIGKQDERGAVESW